MSKIRTVPSDALTTIRLPSGLKATEFARTCSGAPTCLPAATSQIRTALRPATASRVPPGPNATWVTASVGPMSGKRSRPAAAASQIRTVPSAPPDARRLPSGLNATAYTSPVWPVSGVPILLPVATSQIRTAVPSPAVTRRLPSGLNASRITGSAKPVSGLPTRLPEATSQIRTA